VTNSNVNRFELFHILDTIPCCGISDISFGDLRF